jgi:hypothetical protein
MEHEQAPVQIEDNPWSNLTSWLVIFAFLIQETRLVPYPSSSGPARTGRVC